MHYFPMYEPEIDFIQKTDLILDGYFSNELSIAGMYFLHYKVPFCPSTRLPFEHITCSFYLQVYNYHAFFLIPIDVRTISILFLKQNKFVALLLNYFNIKGSKSL